MTEETVSLSNWGPYESSGSPCGRLIPIRSDDPSWQLASKHQYKHIPTPTVCLLQASEIHPRKASGSHVSYISLQPLNSGILSPATGWWKWEPCDGWEDGRWGAGVRGVARWQLIWCDVCVASGCREMTVRTPVPFLPSTNIIMLGR